MEPKTKRMLKIITGVMAALFFGVAVLTFFTFSENDYVADYGKIRQVVAANARVSSSAKSSGYFSFNLKEAGATAESSEESEESEDSGSGSDSATASESSQPSSSAGSPSSKSSSSSSSKSSSSSGAVSSSADAYSSSSALSSSEESSAVPILGRAVLTKSQLLAYSAPHKGEMCLTCSLDELIGYYLSIGEKYGVRGDIAYLQAIIETGWFRYNRPNGYHEYENGEWVYKNGPRPEGYYVLPTDNNFCGLGVTGYVSENNTLCRFDTAALGVEAQIQHLYAYACRAPLPSGTAKVDPRFDLVARGCAPNWDDLAGRWAADKKYGEKILGSYYNVLNNY